MALLPLILLFMAASVYPQQQGGINFYHWEPAKFWLQDIVSTGGYKIRLSGTTHYQTIQIQVKKIDGSRPILKERFIKVQMRDGQRFDGYYYFKDGPGVYKITFWGNKGNTNGFVTLADLKYRCRNTIPPVVQEQLSINDMIVKTVRSLLGTMVGRGECWDLAQKVLDHHHADWKRTMQFGLLVDPHKEKILPGDILQMRKVEIRMGNLIHYLGAPNHTAVVYKVVSKTKFIIAHQNAHKKKFVHTFKLDLRDLIRGSLSFYRPQAGFIWIK